MAKKKAKKGLGFGASSKSSDESESSFSERKLVESLASSAFQQLAALEESAASVPEKEQAPAEEASILEAAPEEMSFEAQEKAEETLEMQAEETAEEMIASSEDDSEKIEEVLADSEQEVTSDESEDEAVLQTSADDVAPNETLGESEEDSENEELAEFGSTNIFTEEEPESFLPNEDELAAASEELPDVESVEGTELDAFESAEIEDVEFVTEEQLDSIVEAVLFASDRPVSLNSLKLVFKGTNIKGDKIKRALDRLAVELAGARRGVSLEEVPGGYQLRTKVDNLNFLTRTLKARQFKLSGPALEVLSIVAYKQPVVKNEIDEIRGVESGHLLRALMEKGLVNFEGKSDLPGKPMNYATTKKFLEIFGLRNLKELPTLSQIDELLPEGMTEEEAKPTLSQVTDSMSQTIGTSYSEGEDELMKIEEQLTNINSSSEFFEQEKLRQQQKRDADRAQNLREAIAMGEVVSTRDRNWLVRYDEALMAGNMDHFQAAEKQEAVAEEKQVELDFIEDEESADEVAMDAAEAAGVSATEEEAPAQEEPASEPAMDGMDESDDHNSGEVNL